MRVTTNAMKIRGVGWIMVLSFFAVVFSDGAVLAQSISGDDLEYSWALPMAPGEKLIVDETLTTLLSWETDGADGKITVALDGAMPPGLQLSVRVSAVRAVDGAGCGAASDAGFLALSNEAPLELVNGIAGATCVEGEAELEYRLEVVDWEEFRGDLNEDVTLVYDYVVE